MASASTSKPKYKILVTCSDTTKHRTVILEFAEILAQAGHDITFSHRPCFESEARNRGFRWLPFDEGIFVDRFNSGHPMVTEWIMENIQKFHAQPLHKYKNWTQDDREMMHNFIYDYVACETALRVILKDYADNFDVLIGNFETRYPSVHLSTIPFIPVFRQNPMPLYKRGPPFFSGYKMDQDQDTQDEYRQAQRHAFKILTDKLELWWRSKGVESLPEDCWFIDNPRQLGFYQFPEDLDYHELGPKYSPHWHRFDPHPDHLTTKSIFKIPKNLVDKPGKLIYVHIGRIGSYDFEWMNRFLKVLSTAPHRFIISKGAQGDLIPLYDNMWGTCYVDQKAILKAVDAVIIHAGIQTLLEVIYHEKPMIVMPFMFDGYDNAQRAHEKGIAHRLDTWLLWEELIHKAIEEMLGDETLKSKLHEVSTKMVNSNSRARAVELIENFIAQNRAKGRVPTPMVVELPILSPDESTASSSS